MRNRSGIKLNVDTRIIAPGLYRVTDNEAVRLAHDSGGQLPHPHARMAVRVNGDVMYLSRLSFDRGEGEAYNVRVPQRGWIWAVHHY